VFDICQKLVLEAVQRIQHQESFYLHDAAAQKKMEGQTMTSSRGAEITAESRTRKSVDECIES
jgi:hypothetical protein